MVFGEEKMSEGLLNNNKTHSFDEEINEKSTNLNIVIDVKEDFADKSDDEDLFDSVIQNDLQNSTKNSDEINSDEWIVNNIEVPNTCSFKKKGLSLLPFKSKFDELFTDSYELEKKENDMFEMNVIDSFSDGFYCTYVKEIGNDNVKDRPGYSFLTLLSSVGKHLGYKIKETSKTIFTTGSKRQLLYNTNTTTFGKRKATYTHPSKITARHMCARDILYQLIEDGFYEKYGIPGKNKEECIKFLDTVMPNLPKQSITDKRADRDRNPTAILNEFCQKRHFPLPEWEKDDIQFSKNNQPIHSGTLHVHIWKTKGQGTSIKKARNDAGEKMLDIVEEFEANNPLLNPYIFD
ncbi:Double-stranded RNA-binding domain-containing protein [Strongyloides ratti]|uniref:Double-stranded RNA-binding domain-containing protein n=1 Tax=Strongyloides ratti TaxID=34506 RepID=A0A090LJ63_STRRB|nr:Double-stranded RNA-binding domain-containing protein [Strongyloides ratti]CEF69743.1 Double-stranded RNA-binding domain-containing protein [Strongyloides ratti]